MNHSRQRGVALFIVLIFLVVLTLLGVTAIQRSTIGERLARNLLDRNLAQQAAEAALRDAELDIRGLANDGSICTAGSTGCRMVIERKGGVAAGIAAFDALCTRGQCYKNEGAYFVPPVWEIVTTSPTQNFWSNTATTGNFSGAVTYGTFTKATPLAGVVQQPRYLIEAFLDKSGAFVFRITAQGYGASTNTVVTLQSVFISGGTIG